MTQCQQIFSVDNFIISLTHSPICDILSGLAGGVCLRPCGPTLPKTSALSSSDYWRLQNPELRRLRAEKTTGAGPHVVSCLSNAVRRQQTDYNSGYPS